MHRLARRTSRTLKDTSTAPSALLASRTEITEVVMTSLSLMAVSLLRGTLIVVSGELDATNVAQLEDYVAEHHPEPARPLVLDLGGLAFMDCTALSLLLRLRDRAGAHGGSFHLIAVQPCPARVLEIAGAARRLDVYPTLEGALQATGLILPSEPSSDIA